MPEGDSPRHREELGNRGPELLVRPFRDRTRAVITISPLRFRTGPTSRCILWVPKTPSKRLTWGFCAGGLEDMIGTGRRSGPFNPGRRVSQPGCYQVSDLR